MCSRVSKATEQHKSTTRSTGIYAGTRSVIYPNKIITTQNRINKAGDSRADMSLCSHFKRVFLNGIACSRGSYCSLLEETHKPTSARGLFWSWGTWERQGVSTLVLKTQLKSQFPGHRNTNYSWFPTQLWWMYSGGLTSLIQCSCLYNRDEPDHQLVSSTDLQSLRK